MAFGSGSSLATDCWEEAQRLALLSPATQGGQSQPYLHQHSSSKPTAHSEELAWAIAISRSLAKLAFFLS
jgi:hypothetical protein